MNEGMLMLLSDSAYLPQGVNTFWIPYEDMLELMPFSGSAYLSKGVGFFLIPYDDKFMLFHKLMLFLIQHICQRGWRMLISYEDKWV